MCVWCSGGGIQLSSVFRWMRREHVRYGLLYFGTDTQADDYCTVHVMKGGGLNREWALVFPFSFFLVWGDYCNTYSTD